MSSTPPQDLSEVHANCLGLRHHKRASSTSSESAGFAIGANAPRSEVVFRCWPQQNTVVLLAQIYSNSSCIGQMTSPHRQAPIQEHLGSYLGQGYFVCIRAGGSRESVEVTSEVVGPRIGVRGLSKLMTRRHQTYPFVIQSPKAAQGQPRRSKTSAPDNTLMHCNIQQRWSRA